MKIKFFKFAFLFVFFLFLTIISCVAYAASSTTDDPSSDSITVVNNATGKNDTVSVTYGLSSGDLVKVYNASSGGKLLGSTRVYGTRTDATVTISQLGTGSGYVYVSVTSLNMLESVRVEKAYSAEPVSAAPDSGNIVITNNSGKSDTVDVSALSAGDTVKVYKTATSTKILGSAKVANNKDEVIVSVAQLGTTGGSVYVSVTGSGEDESDRTEADFDSEPVSDAPNTDNITFTNNAGTSDIVNLSGLSVGDTVKVYNAASGGKLLGSAKVASNSSQVNVSISQLGISAGSVYVSITSSGKNESSRVQADFPAENVSDQPAADNVTITNNAGSSDTIVVDGLLTGDIVKVYNSQTGGKLLGSSSKVASNSSQATVKISQLGTTGGTVYLSVVSTNKLESARASANYTAETKSDNIDSDDVIITNNPAGTTDTVYVCGLSAGDFVKIYNTETGSKVVGSGTVASGKTDLTISVTQLGASGGTLYLSATSKGNQESDRTTISFSSEAKTVDPESNNIIVSNNVGKSDTVVVTGIATNDVIKVYDSQKGGKVLGTATVASNSSQGTVSISQLSSTAGTVYISVTSKGKLESNRILTNYSQEQQSTAPDTNNITVTNNPAGTADTVQVSGISAGDIVKVYDASQAGNLLGSATVASNASLVTVSISQLGSSSGTIYITVTSTNKLESTRTTESYSAETKSASPGSSNIRVTNNAGISDTVDVAGVSDGDTIKVYDSSIGGKLLGSTSVSGSVTNATITISQLGINAGSVYVTITSKGDLESNRVEARYSAESVTSAPNASNVTITNNAGAADTVFVSGLLANDVVKVYDNSIGGTLLGSATVSTYNSDVTVSITQLGTTGGSVYITVTSAKMQESSRTRVTYSAESATEAPDDSQIIVTNNPEGTSDSIQLTGLSSGDIVKVYDSSQGGKTLGTTTVATAQTTAEISVAQLGTTGGSVYVTVTSANMSESARTEADYDQEAKTVSPVQNNITVTNNAGVSDTVSVTALSSGDIVKVYDSNKGGKMLGCATVSTASTNVTVTIAQIGSAGGSVYVSNTSSYKLESDRTAVPFQAETQTDAPDAGNVIVINNAGISDTVTVTSLSGGDTVKVYDAAKGGNMLGSATVSTYSSKAVVSITQLGTSTGNIFVSVTSKSNKLESNRTTVTYSSEPISSTPSSNNITIVNNAGVAGTVKVTGLVDADVINVYDAAANGNLLGTGTVPDYSTQVTVTISQLGDSAGSVYVTLTNKGKLESDRVRADYNAKPKSDVPSSGNIIIVNNVGIPDTVTVAGLAVNDIVNVYNSSDLGEQLGSATVSQNSSQVIISISQLSTTCGSVYITVTSKGKTESNAIRADYTAEQTSNNPVEGNITIVNNAGMSGTVTITGLLTNDVVKVYDASSGGNLLGTATLTSNVSQVVVTVPQLGTSAGSLYISVTSQGKLESSRTQADYLAVSNAPTVGNVVIVNNAVISDTITVSGLTANDLVRVYDAQTGGNLLGFASVAANSTQTTVTITQLTVSAGNVYITVANYGRTESTRCKVSYIAEQSSNSPVVGNVTIVNNATIADTITVSGLTANDVIKVFDSQTGGTLLGTATVQSSATQATISVTQLGTGAGSVYISITSLGKTESARTEVRYIAEQKSSAPVYVTIVNNDSGTSDTITVTGLTAYDTVKVYDSAAGTNLLGSATVQASSTQVTLSISDLGSATGGNVYISVTSLGKTESDKTQFQYSAAQ